MGTKKTRMKDKDPLWIRPEEGTCPVWYYHPGDGKPKSWFYRYCTEVLPIMGIPRIGDPVITLTLPLRLPSHNQALLWHPMQASQNKKLIHQAMYLAATSIEGVVPEDFEWFKDEGCPTDQTLWTYEEFAHRYVHAIMGWKKPSPAWTVFEFYENEDGTKSLHIQSLSARTTDTDSIFPKAAIDGLRKARIIPEDTRKVLRTITYDWMEWVPPGTQIP